MSANNEDQIRTSIEKFMNRPVHRLMTLPIIDSASDEELEQMIVDNIGTKIGSDFTDEFEIVNGLSDGRRMMYSTWLVEAEVNNGGFNQFYFNSSGQFAYMAVQGFRILGAPKSEALMTKANHIFEEIRSSLEKYNDGTWESFSGSYENNPLNECDKEFYHLYEVENLSQLRIGYIRKNKEEFVDEPHEYKLLG